MDGVQGPQRIPGSPQITDRNARGSKQQADAFQQAMQQQGEPPEQKPDESAAQAALRRALQRRARISRNEQGEATHVDVIA